MKHPVTGLMLALENPAAVRSGVRVGMPSVRVRGNVGPVVSATRVQALAGRFGLAGADSALVFQRSDTDGLLMVHEQWGQLFQGVPVYGAGLSVHSNAAGEIVSVTGRLLAETARSVSGPADAALSRPEPAPVVLRDVVTLDAEAARRALLAARIRSPMLAGHTLTAPQAPKLWLYNDGFVRNQPATVSRPAWEVQVRAAAEDLSETFFMDAGDGSVRRTVSGVDHATVRQVYDCGSHYANRGCFLDFLTNAFSPPFIYGRSEGNPPRGPSPGAAPINGSTDVDWFYETGIPNINSHYLTRFGRDGANSFGGTRTPGVPPSADANTRIARVYANADWTTTGLLACPLFAWSGTEHVAFCRGSRINDVIAHEFGHLVARNMSFNANGTRNSLATTNESGALNESNSDLLGESFEKFITGSNDWVFWAGRAGGSVRLLSQPSSLTDPYHDNTPYPDSYHSPDFYCGTAHSGGIHHNSTVPSHAAYLASEGGAFNGCQMQGIGLEKVEQIWYRALTQYYQPNETFSLAYHSLRQACLDLYSAADCAEVTKALQAVEMDQPGKCSGLPARPATCAPTPVLRSEHTVLGPRVYWGSEGAGWTLQVSFDLQPAGWTDVQFITGPGEYLPQVSAPHMFFRLRYGH